MTMKVALPDSGSNAATALAHVFRRCWVSPPETISALIWGDTDIAPSSDEWFGGRTITLQGAAICSAADKLRKDLLARAAHSLKVDAADSQNSGWDHLDRFPGSHNFRGVGRSRTTAPSGRPGRGSRRW